MLEELNILKDILTDKIKINFINRKKLCKYAIKNGISNLYTGKRIDEYSAGINIINTKNKRNTIFKHNDNDYYYYDLLDNNRKCERIYPGVFYLEDACTDIKPVYTKNIIKKR